MGLLSDSCSEPQLFYDPGEKMYVMNVHQVMIEASSPTGLKILRPVTR